MANALTTNTPAKSRVWFVTGCSSGIGRVLAEELIAREEYVVAAARRIDRISDLESRAPARTRAVKVDIADPSSVHEGVRQAVEAFGQIDILVNNAGSGLVAAVEECSSDELQQMFDTNVAGTLNAIQAVLPQMRARRKGHIITVSSMGGFSGSAGLGIYNACKFALEGMHEALRQELAPLGIPVTIIEPGAFKTEFRVNSLVQAKTVIQDYAQVTRRVRGLVENGYPTTDTAADPRIVANAIIAAADPNRSPPFRLPVGADAIAAVKAKLAFVAAELEEWRSFAEASGRV